MAESLNVIALISGGKDSLYSILHCLENGHKVVALANLYPPPRPASQSQNGRKASHSHGSEHEIEGKDEDEDEDEDLNSFMYQTVGYSIIPLYAECLGLPLYRREIHGSALQTGRYYDASNLVTNSGSESSPDETEDLVPLLQDIMERHPKANALCSGAILSTYQRTRVESIAFRLGLTPLAYLWQYPALPPPVGRDDSLTGLLDDMAAAGCDARIIKIASGGIKESLLWANVADPKTRSRLVAGLNPFFPDHEFWLRGAVLGEGGEYETLAIRGPNRLWKKRIEIPQGTRPAVAGDGGVSYIRLAGAKTVQNEPDSSEQEEEGVRVPRALDPQFEAVRTQIQGVGSDSSAVEGEKERGLEQKPSEDTPSAVVLQLSQNVTATCLAISNITATSTVGADVTGTPTDQMRQICKILNSLLADLPSSNGLDCRPTTSNIVFSTLLLREVSHFGAVNSVYATLFRSGEPNPPARVTFACDLPEGVEVSLSIILDFRPRQARRGLHVQSRSYWAPANIGPYSQAICVPLNDSQDFSVNVHDAGLVELVHIAGQIPLIPHSMKVSDGSFLDQAVLSLQHLWRIGQERGVDLWPWGVALVKKSINISAQALEASQVWQQVNLIGTRPEQDSSSDETGEDEDGPDAWDRQYNRFSQYGATVAQTTVGEHLHMLPNPRVLREASSKSRFVPPFIAAEVVSLPRDATVEWWSLGVANLPKLPESVPRISTSRQDYTWGSICRVSVHPPKKERNQEHDRKQDQDQSASNTTDTTINLMTVLIHSPLHHPTSSIREGIDVVEQDLAAFLSGRTDSGTSSSLEVVHGTAFVSAEYQTPWSKKQKQKQDQDWDQSLFANLTVIPCKSVHGRASSSSSNSGLADQGNEDKSSENFQPAVQAGSDSPPRVSKKSVAQEASSTSTAFKNNAAQSCQPQPLAAALTMRIDGHNSSSSQYRLAIR
ncbi:hypothetical protein A1O1_01205 [Capronia coronata CBS 617.96]|uniref:Diphthine--ammonia ligase n=1 Tax=Capronia coronata CBS 617.96 TaxID=1182541 RepID=W9ZNM1_9EURO|nr:uncharacterized protein A1O1_01205 [Capronia coronata CBS 617.96]EXJ96079.1 hypothetical protein A1O1_01205 [Capronia coronata CBS 617.96]